MWGTLLLLVAAADAGTSARAPTAASATPARPASPRRNLPLSSTFGAAEFRDVVSGASTTGPAPVARPAMPEDPSTRVEVREPDPSFDAGIVLRSADARTGVRAEATPAAASAPDASTENTNQALLEQAKAQTEAMQALLAQQQAQEQSRAAEQQARTERAAAVQEVRDAIGGTVQALATSGNYDSSSLSQASASLRRTAAAASASGAVGEASRANEAAAMVDAAQSALTQRNAQQAQWYLTRAAQLLADQQPQPGRGY